MRLFSLRARFLEFRALHIYTVSCYSYDKGKQWISVLAGSIVDAPFDTSFWNVHVIVGKGDVVREMGPCPSRKVDAHISPRI